MDGQRLEDAWRREERTQAGDCREAQSHTQPRAETGRMEAPWDATGSLPASEGALCGPGGGRGRDGEVPGRGADGPARTPPRHSACHCLRLFTGAAPTCDVST